ncbi:uncharacterized protein yc1106_09056 [Curvularia clavata]|uniref:DUF218 domain-containing protein n=1 Tax=Curvularia clavata TaxID=95742 RepID=A0A9Q8ZGZ0_CURCL|nr:uncharacterized protein yc1106_09056 [Curvularia clavata]
MASAAQLVDLPKSKSNSKSKSRSRSQSSSRSQGSASTDSPAKATENTEAQTALEHRQQPFPQGQFVHPPHEIPPPSYPDVPNLIIVCCHAIFLPNADASNLPLYSPYDESNWLLAPFQKSDAAAGKPGEHETFISHIKAGLDALTVGVDAKHPLSSILVFSGGATKRAQTLKTEARSYYHAALATELAEGHLGGGRAYHHYEKKHILLEEEATDSFQNLLFSILLFRKITGKYPEHIRVITHAFKAKRFLELHAPTIKWPKNRIQVQGIDPVMPKEALTATLLGEEKSGYAAWEEDPLGTGDLLGGKRQVRGWNASTGSKYFKDLEDSVKELFQGRVSDQLPWIE